MCEQVKDPWLESELNEEKKEKRISQEDMKVENLFENGKLRRLLLLETLGKDYLSFCLINTKRRTVVVLNTGFENMENGTDMGPELPYEETCARIVEKYAPENQKAYILEKEKLEHVLEELSKKKEYNFTFEAWREGRMHDCQMRFIDMGDSETILMAVRYIDEVVAKVKEEREDAIMVNEMKSRFLSSISHDIRTPVNGILGMLRIADTYPNDLKKQNECREKMWVAANYLVSLVNNVLDINRLENKMVDLSEQPFNLIDFLMNVTSLTDMQSNAQGLHSVVDWKPGYIEHRYLIGSSEGLARILMNLNSNAIKYNKKGGSIYCRCKEISCDGETAWFEFVNSDTGIGMSPEFLEHAFEPYMQADNNSLSSIKGVGLGLAIVKQTVEAIGGTLDVESRLNEGTKYTIRLPFKLDPNPTVKAPTFEHLSLKGVKALLVEDNELNMEIAKFHLEQENVQVFTAVNGEEAVEMFQKSEVGFFDIILMDIMMPIMDGLEATRRIRNMNRADAMSIPIIAMSANAFQEDIEKSLEAGLNEHLVKPLDGKTVTDTMKKFLANKIAK